MLWPGNNNWLKIRLKENGVVILDNKKVDKDWAVTTAVAMLRNMDKYHSNFFLLFISLRFNLLQNA